MECMVCGLAISHSGNDTVGAICSINMFRQAFSHSYRCSTDTTGFAKWVFSTELDDLILNEGTFVWN